MSGIEVFYQVGLQIILLLLTLTETATVGGLEAFFKQNSKVLFGIYFSPKTIIIVSVVWSLKTAILLHVEIISIEKGFFGFKAKTMAFLWGLVASVRRVLGIVAFFSPCLGLMNLLWHWHGEQFPFDARKAQVMWLGITPSPNEKIELYWMSGERLWADYDRWNYTDPTTPKAPVYTLYTGLSAKMTLIAFFLLLSLHILTVTLVKLCTSEEFRSRDWSSFQKIIHVICNINIPSPFQDWDVGDFSVEEHRRRHRRTEREMGCLFIVNTVFSLVLLGPLWYTGQKCFILFMIESTSLNKRSEIFTLCCQRTINNC